MYTYMYRGLDTRPVAAAGPLDAAAALCSEVQCSKAVVRERLAHNTYGTLLQKALRELGVAAAARALAQNVIPSLGDHIIHPVASIERNEIG